MLRSTGRVTPIVSDKSSIGGRPRSLRFRLVLIYRLVTISVFLLCPQYANNFLLGQTYGPCILFTDFEL